MTLIIGRSKLLSRQLKALSFCNSGFFHTFSNVSKDSKKKKTKQIAYREMHAHQTNSSPSTDI